MGKYVDHRKKIEDEIICILENKYPGYDFYRSPKPTLKDYNNCPRWVVCNEEINKTLHCTNFHDVVNAVLEISVEMDYLLGISPPSSR